jgi:hypothetical protein
MTREAAKAVENAITFECKKDGLQQRQSGDWQFRVTIASADMDQRLTQAPMGTRYQCVLVEVDDDEGPTDHKAKDRDKWRDLGAARQAGIRCKEPMFWAYLTEELHYPFVDNEEAAARAVRHACDVASRSDLDRVHNTDARERWFNIDFAYQAWKARENG